MRSTQISLENDNSMNNEKNALPVSAAFHFAANISISSFKHFLISLCGVLGRRRPAFALSSQLAFIGIKFGIKKRNGSISEMKKGEKNFVCPQLPVNDFVTQSWNLFFFLDKLTLVLFFFVGQLAIFWKPMVYSIWRDSVTHHVTIHSLNYLCLKTFLAWSWKQQKKLSPINFLISIAYRHTVQYHRKCLS